MSKAGTTRARSRRCSRRTRRCWRGPRPAARAAWTDSTIVDPVYIEENVTLKKSKVGPNVSIGAGSVIEGSKSAHTIIGSKARSANRSSRTHSLAMTAMLEGVKGEVTVGDHSEVQRIVAPSSSGQANCRTRSVGVGELLHRRLDRDDLPAASAVSERACWAPTPASSERSKAPPRRRRRCSSS